MRKIHVWFFVQALASEGDETALEHTLFFDVPCWPADSVSTVSRQQPVSLWEPYLPMLFLSTASVTNAVILFIMNRKKN